MKMGTKMNKKHALLHAPIPNRFVGKKLNYYVAMRKVLS